MVFLRQRALVVVLMCLLLSSIPPLVNGNKPKYESRKTCFASVKEILKQGVPLLNTYTPIETTSGGAPIGKIVREILGFAKSNPAAAFGIAASSCLLYDAIVMLENVNAFFHQYKELREEFASYYKDKMESLTARLRSIKTTADLNKEQQKLAYQVLYKDMQLFSDEIDRHLKKANVVIDAITDAQFDNQKVTSLSAGLAVVAVFGAPAQLRAAIVIAGISGTACVISLLNGEGLSTARATLKGLEAEVKRMEKDAQKLVADIVMNM